MMTIKMMMTMVILNFDIGHVMLYFPLFLFFLIDLPERPMDEQTDGWTDGRTDGWMARMY